jgi:hypothetical protein
MDKIKTKYLNQINTSSDINEHIETLYEYSKDCSHITEMGVRWVSSTWAFVYAAPQKIISYDIIKSDNINEVLDLTKEYGINYSFEEKDVLNIEIEETDILFIDTLHTYNQLFAELNLHASKVKKYIILHDTVTFGEVDEYVYMHASQKIKNKEINKQGLMNAIKDFINSQEGQDWMILKTYENNNGLTILKNKKYE